MPGCQSSRVGAMQSRRPHFPPAAVEWLVGHHSNRVLALSDTSYLPRMIAGSGHPVFAADKNARRVQGLARTPGVEAVLARAEALPFESCSFDVVLVHQVLHHFAPGLVLPEFARLLTATGWVSASYLVRDDSVPWVRRLLALIRGVDPGAMAGQYGSESLQTLINSKYFPQHEERSFRIWVPIERDGMIAMVAGLPAISRLAEAERSDVLADAGLIYDSASTGNELLLPYQLQCVRAHVDHDELTHPIRLTDDALIIPL